MDGFRNGLISAGLNHAMHYVYNTVQRTITIKQMLQKYGYGYRGKIFQATKKYIMEVINTISELKEWWIKAGKPKINNFFYNSKTIVGAYYWSRDGLGYVDINIANIFNNFRLVSALFHEFHHAYWKVSGTYDYYKCELGLKKAHALNEIEAYEFQWSLGGFTDSDSTKAYYHNLNVLYP